MITSFRSLCGAAVRHKKSTVAAWSILLIAAVLGCLKLEFSYDYRSFFDTANPELKAFDAIEKQFSPTDSVNFVLHAKDGDFFEPGAMETLDWLTGRVLDIPYTSRSQSAANYQYSFSEDDDIVVEALFVPARRSTFKNASIRAEIKEKAAGETGLMGRLLSPDFKTAQVIATIRLPSDEGNVLPAIQAEVSTIKAELAARAPDLRVATTGVVMLSQTFFEITVRDMLLLFPVITLVVTLILAWFFQSWRAAGLCLLIIVLSIGAAMGLAGWAGVRLTPATGPAPIIIMTVALVDSVHLLASYFKKRSGDFDRLEAATYAVEHNLRAILLTSVTTTIGFLTLNFSDTPPFRELGNIAAAGTLIALLLSVTLLPALLQFGKARANPCDPHLNQFPLGILAKVSRTLRWPIIALCTLSALAATYAMSTLKVQDSFVEWVGYSHPFRSDAEFIQQKLPALFAQQYALVAPAANGITHPDYLADLERFAAYVKQQPGVSHVLSFDTIMRRLNLNLNEDKPAFDRLPTTPAEGAQYLLLYEMSLPFGEDLTNLLSIDRSASRVVVTLKPQSSADMQRLRADIFSWAEQNLQHSRAEAGTGTNMIFAELTRSNTRSMLIGSLVAAIAIGGALVIALGNVKLGALSLIPNIAPPLYAFGMWAMLVGSLGLYGAFVVATALGLIVDATVHMLEKYQSALRTGHADPVAAMLKDVGPAILISSAVLLAGFGVLTFSSFAIIAQLAKLVFLTLLLAIVTDFLLLPALLYTLKPAHAGTGSGAASS